jgi:hypothetical protein
MSTSAVLPQNSPIAMRERTHDLRLDQAVDPLAEAYDNFWRKKYENRDRRSFRDNTHIGETHAALAHWYAQLTESHGLKRSDQQLIVIGPGREFVERGLGPALSANVSRHRAVVGIDWSRGTLEDFRRQCNEKLGGHPRIETEQVDLSAGLSGSLEMALVDQLDQLEEPGGVEAFTRYLVQLIEEYDSILQRELSLDRPENIEKSVFHRITEQVGTCRLAMGTLVLGGMFALTESKVRAQLMDVHTRFPSQVTGDNVREVLSLLHNLVTKLNTYVSARMVRQYFHATPGPAHMIQITETNATYVDGHDTHPRLDVVDLRYRLKQQHIDMLQAKCWVQNDEDEEPPHTHVVSPLSFYRNGHNGSGALLQVTTKLVVGNDGAATGRFGGGLGVAIDTDGSEGSAEDLIAGVPRVPKTINDLRNRLLERIGLAMPQVALS